MTKSMDRCYIYARKKALLLAQKRACSHSRNFLRKKTSSSIRKLDQFLPGRSLSSHTSLHSYTLHSGIEDRQYPQSSSVPLFLQEASPLHSLIQRQAIQESRRGPKLENSCTTCKSARGGLPCAPRGWGAGSTASSHKWQRQRCQ